MMNITSAFKEETLGIVTRRLIPFLMLLYLVAYLDRSNISVAALQMNADLGLSARMYGLGAGLFYVSYIIFEVPSNVILVRVGARRWIARIMLTWGLVACGMAFIHTPTQLYSMRLLLGAAEAGFTPGIIYYLSRWFPSSNRARAMSFFYIGAALASVIGLPLSGGLLKLDGFFGIAGWRWLYLVEGVPAMLLGLVVLKCLPDSPSDAKWLSPAQSEWLTRTIAKESTQAPGGHAAGWRHAFTDSKVWLLSAFWLLQAFGTIGVTLFLPQILKGLSGASNFEVSLLSALPFLLACVLMYFNGLHSDAHQERRLHLGVPLLISGFLLAISIYAGNLTATYLLLLVAVGLNWAVTPVFWAVTTEYLAGGAAAAGAIALINAVANLAGVGLPPVMGYIKDATGSYDDGLLLVAGALVLGGALGLSLARRCAVRPSS
ncbi:MFS transporter [Herbaspirillum sp. RTI4]|uniref:MFS transporter n=1 Tax=Herbaspirillum sp. RTI4 TaxID=3048640 RepID=UPI002AB5C11A|nr:MFS transporter [Herbaspirillum sp. RTI4]MDY7578763.1 MFS transporter [Herbaspirillum sp. RTI4]MEA9982317.1 MFS transporter [Herbaspirillum sp. RTI4]